MSESEREGEREREGGREGGRKREREREREYGKNVSEKECKRKRAVTLTYSCTMTSERELSLES